MSCFSFLIINIIKIGRVKSDKPNIVVAETTGKMPERNNVDPTK
jgi:hypothetical protein